MPAMRGKGTPQCRGLPESQNPKNRPDDGGATWCNKYYVWRPRWTRRTTRRRAPAQLSQRGVASDGSAILSQVQMQYIVWGTRPLPRTTFLQKPLMADKAKIDFPRTNHDRQTLDC